MKTFLYYLPVLVMLSFSSSRLSAQTISGPTTVDAGEVVRYTFSGSGYYPDGWESADGELLLDENGVRLSYMDVKWDTPGSHDIEITYTFIDEYGYEDYDYVSFSVQVLYVEAPVPPAPIVQSNEGGTVTLAWASGKVPPQDVSWYWQSTLNGTSTANPNSTIGLTSDGTYYLRAKNNVTGTWSDTTSEAVTFTVAPPPIWYDDSDSDGFGASSPTITSYTQPTGYVDNNLDQCPGEAGVYEGCLTKNDGNYVHTINFQEPYSEASLSNGIPVTDQIESISYFDGLGSSIQNINVRAGGSSEDIITHIAYDDYGRQDKEYLPYPSTTDGGRYRTDALAATQSFYNSAKYENTLNPYSEKHLEFSPLSRVLEQGAPGADWAVNKASDADHTIKFEHRTNTGSEVGKYEVTLTKSVSNGVVTYIPALVLNGTYGVNELYKMVTKDENWQPGQTYSKDHTTEEFKDKQGQVLLKRAYNSGVAHDTYYVYDDYGNLTYVLPPKAEPSSAKPDATELSELCYQYKYDDQNRLVEKKIPGKGWEYIVYNNLDQPVLTQDPNLEAQDKWLFTKYDAFGRVAYTGYISNANTRLTLQGTLDGAAANYETRQTSASSLGGTSVYYSNNAKPQTSISEIYTINYYDSYDNLNIGFTIPTSNSFGETIVKGTGTKGLATVNKTKVLGTSNWITTATGYDIKGRVVWTKTHNLYLGATDIVEHELDFTGAILETKTTHQKTGKSDIVIQDYFTYDPMKRLTKHTQSINGSSLELIALNEYDELGELIGKGVGNLASSSSRLQDIDYSYNIRGWLKEINNVGSTNKLFNFKLSYNDPVSGTPLFNGNISRVDWRTDNTDSGLKYYQYYYDDLNRITSATANSTNYNLSGITYDKNGNIITLTRKGAINSGATSFGSMDVLAYGYNSVSNKLKMVNDSGNDTYGFKDGSSATTQYTYDTNGNLISDLNKGIPTGGISYNHLNLPTSITLLGGTINYTYDATGVKLQKKIVESGQPNKYTFYEGNYVYERSGDSGTSTLKFYNHTDGYVEPDGNGGFDYVYQYKDHLGNVRLTYADLNNNGTIEPSSEILDEKNYYPFGLEHKGYNTGVIGVENNYMTYNGKELNESWGLNLLEMDFRQYDPAIARFTSIDPVTHFDFSPYQAFDNNPIYWADPSGADGEHYNWETGRYEDDKGNEVSFETALASVGLNRDGSEQSNDSDSNEQDAQSDPDPLTNVQLLEKRGWLGSLFQNRQWSPENSPFNYEVGDDGFLTGEKFIRVTGGSGSIELISTGGLSLLRLPKYLKYLRGIKSTRDALRFAVKSSDAFKLISGGNRFKAVLEGGSLGAGQFFTQLVKNGWTFQKSGKNIKLLKDGETIIFRGSSAKKGFDTFTLPKAHEGKNVDIFFQ